jgi:glycosyltransferase involved in cell wall biosynthesis
MLVAQLLTTHKLGGAERVALTLCQIQDPQLEFVYVAPDGDIADIARQNGVDFLPLKGDFGAASVREAFGRRRPDLVHGHDYRGSVVASMAAPRGVPVISHIHTVWPWSSSWNLRTAVYVTRAGRYSRVIASSQTIADAISFAKAIRQKVMVVRNGVDLERVRGGAGERVTESDLIFVGRLEPQKDPLRFIRVVHLLRKAKPEVQAVLVGDGTLRGECERLIRDLGLENNAHLLGFQGNPYGYIAASKVLLATSIQEGFGLGVAEAMALGKPVITSDLPAFHELVQEVSGFICKSENAMAAQAWNLLKEPQLALEMGKAGAAYIEAEVTVQHQTSAIAAEYKRLLS